MFQKVVIAAVCFVFFGQMAAFAEWKYQKLELVNENNRQDVLTVSIDYEVKSSVGNGPPVPSYSATPVYINAWSSKPVDGAQAVFRSMVFNNYSISLESILSGDYDFLLRTVGTEIVDMQVEGNHLFGSLRNPVLLSETPCYKCVNRGVQELAIVLSGEWYKGTNRRDLRFTMPASSWGY